MCLDLNFFGTVFLTILLVSILFKLSQFIRLDGKRRAQNKHANRGIFVCEQGDMSV